MKYEVEHKSDGLLRLGVLPIWVKLIGLRVPVEHFPLNNTHGFDESRATAGSKHLRCVDTDETICVVRRRRLFMVNWTLELNFQLLVARAYSSLFKKFHSTPSARVGAFAIFLGAA
jgi:hypothetical protein